METMERSSSGSGHSMQSTHFSGSDDFSSTSTASQPQVGAGQPAMLNYHVPPGIAPALGYGNVPTQTGVGPPNNTLVNSSPLTRLANQSMYPIRHSNIHWDREWQKCMKVCVILHRLPMDITTREICDCFREEGVIKYIELKTNQQDTRFRDATLFMSPPPRRPLWVSGRYTMRFNNGRPSVVCGIRLGGKPETKTHTSPVNNRIKYPEIMEMRASCLQFGTLLSENRFLSKLKIPAVINAGIVFRLDLSRLERELTIEFLLSIRDRRDKDSEKRGRKVHQHDRDEMFKFRIPLSQLKIIRLGQMGDGQIGINIALETPPKFFKRIELHDDQAAIWNEKYSWFRQTDIVYNPATLKNAPVMLRKANPVLNLGRWTAYRLVIDTEENDMAMFNKMQNALRDYNVIVTSQKDLEIETGRTPPFWDLVDRPPNRRGDSQSALQELLDNGVTDMPFEVRYQLEVCLSHGYLCEYKIGQDFVDRLNGMEVGRARDLLEFIANQKKKIYEPLSIFELTGISGSTGTAKIPPYCTLVRSATVTPTTIHFQTPTVETSNRVIRQFAKYADHFLRVRFSDEKGEGRIFSTTDDKMNEVFTRVKRTLNNGISIGNRRYHFLAFGNSQLRESGAYFFSPAGDLNTFSIRNWMGHFKDIKTVAKHASRLGQCFSTSRAIGNAKANIKELRDTVHGSYMFTDGVGKISPFLAQIIAEELGILSPMQQTPPSLFQFRLGGCKGVLAVSPDSNPCDIHIRPSQYKFPASHEGLEIVRWSRYASARLNRQLILVLSSLGVKDDIFKNMMTTQLSALEQAMVDQTMALNMLQRHVDHNQTTLILATMILDGFQVQREPFMMSLLRLWRAWSVKYLKEKAQISIDRGAFLLGCVDETASLKGHYNWDPKHYVNMSAQQQLANLPEIFVQLSRDPENPGVPQSKILQGPMLIARNPSLHPGDIRVVRGVDVKGLHHLKDVVVFPKTGDRDIPSMCSGGDLDGDDFIVIWDHDLFPTEINYEPMDYSAPKPQELNRDVTTDDLTTFFVTYMKNDTLATIAHAHVAWADKSEDGVKDERCVELAQLHSRAVDFPKTGLAAQMTPNLKPKEWPHFMEKKYKPKSKIYNSEKILGQLFDMVERIDFNPAYFEPFDRRILEAFDLDEELLEKARQVKQEYDAAMLRIMAQHEINTEFEVWSTLVLSHSNISNDYKFHEQIGELSSALKDRYRDLCFKTAGVKSEDQISLFAAAMYKITAEEIATAVSAESRRLEQAHGQEGMKSRMPLMSFPWLFQKVLGKIAQGSDLNEGIAQSMPTLVSLPWLNANSHRTAVTETTLQELQTLTGSVQPGETFQPFQGPSSDIQSETQPDHRTVSHNSKHQQNETTANGGTTDQLSDASVVASSSQAKPDAATDQLHLQTEMTDMAEMPGSQHTRNDLLDTKRTESPRPDPLVLTEQMQVHHNPLKKADRDNEYISDEDVDLDLSNQGRLHGRLAELSGDISDSE